MERLGLLALPPVPPPPVHSPLPCPSILRGLVMRPAATPAEAEARGRGSTMRISWQASTTPSHESEARSKGGQWHEHLAGTRQDGKTQESWGGRFTFKTIALAATFLLEKAIFEFPRTAKNLVC